MYRMPFMNYELAHSLHFQSFDVEVPDNQYSLDFV